jgi:hypothetical protein
MKTVLLPLVLIMTALFALAEDDALIGRFQLVNATIEMTGKTVSAQQRVLFRIDTKTGKTWTYVLGESKDGKILEFWSPVDESPKQR